MDSTLISDVSIPLDLAPGSLGTVALSSFAFSSGIVFCSLSSDCRTVLVSGTPPDLSKVSRFLSSFITHFYLDKY